MPTLLDSVRGQGLCVSLLLDPRTRHWSQDQSCGTTGTPNLPDDSSLRHTIGEFKKSLEVTEELHRQRDDWPKRLVSLVCRQALPYHSIPLWGDHAPESIDSSRQSGLVDPAAVSVLQRCN